MLHVSMRTYGLCVQSLAGLMGQAYHSDHPAANKILQQLLMKWAQRAFAPGVKPLTSSERCLPTASGPLPSRDLHNAARAVDPVYLDLHQAFTVTTCAPAVVRLVAPHERHARAAAHGACKRTRAAGGGPTRDGSGEVSGSDGGALKRRRASGGRGELAADADTGEVCQALGLLRVVSVCQLCCLWLEQSVASVAVLAPHGSVRLMLGE